MVVDFVWGVCVGFFCFLIVKECLVKFVLGYGRCSGDGLVFERVDFVVVMGVDFVFISDSLRLYIGNGCGRCLLWLLVDGGVN